MSVRLPAAVLASLSLCLAAPQVAAALPVVHLRTERAIPDDPKVAGTMRVGSVRTRIGIEVRGHSSQRFPKKQFSVETRDRRGDNRDVAPLGLPASDDWVLSAPYSDKTLMRNALAYRTARRMGRYAPRTRFVELRLNGDAHGVYVLTERPKLGDGRLPERDGGFLLEMTFRSQEVGEDHFHVPVSGRPILWTDPDREDLSRKERRRVRRQVVGFERALYARGKAGPSRRIAERMDLAAAADYTIVQELFKNQDAFHGSTFFHRGADGRIVMGPVWDFDLSTGNHTGPPANRVPGWTTRDAERKRAWVTALWRSPAFRERLRTRWAQLRRDGLRAQVLGDVDRMRQGLDAAAGRNFRRWPILGTYVWPNPVDPATGTYRPTWGAEVAHLRGFLAARFDWLDRELRRGR